MEISNYEFNAAQNESIKKLIKQMMFVSISIIVLGALFTGYALYHLFSAEPNVIKFIMNLVGAIVLVVMGLVTINSAQSFKLVVKTEGNDIENLMNALDKLTTWFSIQTMMIIIGIVIIILGFLLTVL